MKVKMFYKTQREIAEIINQVIDAYWENEIEEAELIVQLKYLYENNASKISKNNEFTTILKQQCGKRRLEVLEKIIHQGELK